MAHYAYIDESGTKYNQEVMTVALIILEGAFTAQKIHKTLLSKLYPNCLKSDTANKKTKLAFHYTDMKKEHKEACSTILATYNIECFISCFYHEGSGKSHDELFAIYLHLVKSCIIQALGYHKDLVVIIAQQGGWTNYKPNMIANLQQAITEFVSKNSFKKIKFEFHSSAKPGIQIADFYAGVVRDYLLKHKDTKLARPYESVENQIRTIKAEFYTHTAKRKGKV